MNPFYQVHGALLLAQGLLTVFLAALFVLLYLRLDRQRFIGWWALGWSAFALQLGGSAFVLWVRMESGWPAARWAGVMISELAGYGLISLLLLGAWSLREARPRAPRPWVPVVGGAVVLGLLAIAVSLRFADRPLIAYLTRAVPRQLLASAVFAYCTLVLVGWWRRTRSVGAGVTAVAWGLWTVNQLLYAATGADSLARRLLGAGFMPVAVDQAMSLLWGLLDMVFQLGIATGMVMLMLEQHRRATERFRVLISNTSDVIMVVDADATIREALSISKPVFGYAEGELEGRCGFDLVHPDDRERVRAFLAEHAAVPGLMPPLEHRVATKAGDWVWVEGVGNNLLADPRVGGIVVSIRDISERWRAERALRQSEERYRAFIRNSTEGIWCDELDVPLDVSLPEDRQIEHLLDHSRVAEANDAMARMYGCRTAGELVGMPLRAFFRDLTPANLDYLRRYVRSGYRITDGETRERDGRGEYRVFLNNLWGVVENGRLVRTWGTQRDITERTQAEELQSAVYRIAQAAERAADLDTLYRAVHGIVQSVMSARNFYIALYDPATDELSFPYFVDETDEVPVARRGGRGLSEYVLRTRRPLLCDKALDDALRKAGEIAPIGAASEVWAGVPLVAEGDALGVMAVQDYRDAGAYGDRELRVLEFVSSQVAQAIRRKRAEEARERLQADVRRSAMEWRRTFDAIESPILLLDAGAHVLRLNQAAKMLVGHSYRAIIGRHVGALGAGEPWRRIAELVACVAETRAGADAEGHDESTGRTWDLSVTSVRADQPQQALTIVVARDITRVVELQESLRRSETMSAMGALVAGVAHEVRNPLFSMSATLDAFEARYGVKREYQQHLAVLRAQLDRLTTLMQELLEYGKPPSPERSVHPLEEVLAEAVGACAAGARQARIRIVRRTAPGLPPLVMDRGRLVQVFTNLVENAVQHAPAGSDVVLEAQARSAAGRTWVECAVADAGPGFAIEDLGRVFEPFFTRRRGGTGLGLSIVQRIVEQHGGIVTAENQAAGGAVVRVRLPLPAA